MILFIQLSLSQISYLGALVQSISFSWSRQLFYYFEMNLDPESNNRPSHSLHLIFMRSMFVLNSLVPYFSMLLTVRSDADNDRASVAVC